MIPTWSYICRAISDQFLEAQAWLRFGHLTGDLTQEVVDECWVEVCRVGAGSAARALVAEGHCPSSSLPMKTLFSQGVREILDTGGFHPSKDCFQSLLAAQHQVTDDTAFALLRAGHGEGLEKALFSGAWNPTPDLFMQAFRLASQVCFGGFDSDRLRFTRALTAALLRKCPRFACEHPETAHALMQEIVVLCLVPGWGDLRETATEVLAMVIGSGHRYWVEDETALATLVSKIWTSDLGFISILGRAGYRLPESKRAVFFKAVLEPVEDPEVDSRLLSVPWQKWVQDGCGIDPDQLAQRPEVAAAWGAMIAQNKAEVLRHAWSDDRVSASCERARL